MTRPRGRIKLLDKDGTPEKEYPRFKIAIAVPTRGNNPSAFTYCLASLTGHASAALVNNDIADFTLAFNEGTYIHTNRNDLAGTCLKAGADYIFWLDDDMTFPKDALLRLLAHNVPIVGANYPTRKIPVTPVAIKTIGMDGNTTPERLQTREEDTGLERVEAIGFGCVLVKAQVFWDVGFPWFENTRDEESKRWVGEDVDFCIKARAAGHDVFVDHGLSHEVRHIGQMEYSVAHAVAFDGDEHGDNELQRVTDDDQQLAESSGHDDAGNHPRLHSTGGSEAGSDGGDS